jgi:diaminopimelate epimerase
MGAMGEIEMEQSLLQITKMHGLGNSYIYVNQFHEELQENELPELARRMSDIHTGIGSDGMILIGPSERADFRMRIFNIDGSEGRNCGNGLRCVAKYVYERRLTDKSSFRIETLGGIAEVNVHAREGNCTVESVTVNMGQPGLLKKDLPMAGDPESTTINEMITASGYAYRITAVSMGNPHAVIFVPNVTEVQLEVVGPRIECSPLFPERVNVEFVTVRNKREIDFRVWERGSGITQACGTGACAAVVAGVLNRWLEYDTPVTVHLPGGDLEIVWASNNQSVYMKGPAEFVMDGEFKRR